MDNEGKILQKYLNITLNELSKTAQIILVIGNSPNPDVLDLKYIFQGARINRNKNKVNGAKNNMIFKLNNIIRAEVSKHPKAYYMDFNDILCNRLDCAYSNGNNSIFMDTGHFSNYGSNYIGEEYIKRGIDPVFLQIRTLYQAEKVSNNKQINDHKQ
ncbi:hypothetical protein ABSA28_00194 [Candidatus Hepatincolaceae symbiont of Richtersius coronifer]